MYRCELPGRDCVSSEDDTPTGRGRSRDAGRNGGGMRVSMSVDLDRTRDIFERLAGCGRFSPALVALLNVRHTEATLDSDSDLLFSRLKVPKPNFLRREEALELQEPMLSGRSSSSELEADTDALLPSSGKTGLPVDV